METTAPIEQADLIPEDERKAYLKQRLGELGITDEQNSIALYNPDADFPINPHSVKEIFSHDERGNIKIRVYRVNGEPITFLKKSDAKTASLNGKEVAYFITRLRVPVTGKDGGTIKYLMPKKEGTFPFFPPQIVEAYTAKTPIDTLILSEGYFKAFKACMHGFMCVGLPSITCLKSKETGELHPDIKLLIETCNVKRIVWLHDGDCLDLSRDIKEDTDLYRRPHGFYRSVQIYFELLTKYDHVTKYYAYVRSSNLHELGNPKGLDDLLVKMPGQEKEALDDLLSFERFKGGENVGNYFVRFNLEVVSLSTLRKHFLIHDVQQFYLHHMSMNAVLQHREFIFNGTKYKYDSDKNEVMMVAPGDAKQYFMVGNDFYKHLVKPDKYGKDIHTYEQRAPSAIRYHQNLSAKESPQFFKHIPKYESFCCVPDHVNYQQTIRGCFNVYHPFPHEPKEGDYSITLEFIKHIFGSKVVKYTRKGETKAVDVPYWELGLDYIQLLYKRPQQVLPIVCLVSNERSTGKSTFIKWLSRIFGENHATVGNDDFKNDFNAHWSNKLIIACDETKIDKENVLEKLKSLSTADKIMMNAKGKQQLSMEFFGKFILASNNEGNFVNVDEAEIRFWVLKVPKIQTNNVDLLSDMEEEIEAFLQFLNTRQMVTDHEERHWFNNQLLKTEALAKIVQHSKPMVVKEIRSKVRDYFYDFGLEPLHMDMKNIAQLINKNMEKNYIERILEDEFKLVRGLTSRQRHYRWEEGYKTTSEGEGKIYVNNKVEVQTHGRHFVFLPEDFLTPEEITTIAASEEKITKTNTLDLKDTQTELPLGQTPESEDLPF